MGTYALLLDIGSTFTKALVCDRDRGRIVARSQAATTAADDVVIGVEQAIARLHAFGLPGDIDSPAYAARYATSSAAGGLRMVVVGLTPGLTARAARETATGAGARIYGVFSGKMDADAAAEVMNCHPDILLFTGGIDGGNEASVLENARILRDIPNNIPIVVACNRVVAGEVRRIFTTGQREVYVAPNVMPGLDRLDVVGAREIIRQVFMQHIVAAKGLARLADRLSMGVLPTPYAVMQGVQLMGEKEEVVAVDVGGATTDVYSAAIGAPLEPDLIPRGLPQPNFRRTVEGDLGVREGIRSLLEIAREDVLDRMRKKITEFDADALATAERERYQSHTYLPSDGASRRLEGELARACIDIGSRRHAGFVEVEDTPTGPVKYLWGKDLRGVTALVGTGGAFLAAARRRDSQSLLRGALYTGDAFLRPRSPRLLVDPGYAVFAAGLLSFHDPDVARAVLGELRAARLIDDGEWQEWERSSSWMSAEG